MARKKINTSLVLDKLAASCLDAEDAAALMIGDADMAELKAQGYPVKQAMEIPYFHANGRPTGFKRWRYLESTLNGFDKLTHRESLRYLQPKDTLPEIYLPPLADWRALQKDVNQSLIVTEGELKAACCTRHVAPCIGLGGVWSFKSTKKKLPLLPAFYEFEWPGRKVYIAYDSDAHTKPQVIQARNELGRQLLALGAAVSIIDLTDSREKLKRGVDDFILQEGSAAFQQLIIESKELSSSMVLHDLNEEVAYVRDPGMVVELASGQKMRPYDFTSHSYANRIYRIDGLDAKGNPKQQEKSAAAAWLTWPFRFELGKIVYEPGAETITPGNNFNTWPGWGIEPKRGDVTPWRELLDYLFEGSPEHRSWFERWCALPLQQPGVKMYTAAVIWGINTGTGKSLVGSTLGRIYGQNYALIGDTQLQDTRNEWAQNKQFVMGDDVTGHDQRKYADRLKAMITQETMRIDPKYIPSFSIRDCINYLFTSNHPDAFFLEDDDRRNFVHEVQAKPLPPEFYRGYMEWLNEGGAARLFYHLLHLNLEGMRPEDRAPNTASRMAMVEDGLSDLGRWVRRLRDDPDIILKLGDARLAGDLWSSGDLVKLYDPEARGRATAGGIGRELKRAGLQQIYSGMPVKTFSGHQRLFALRNGEQWKKAKGPEITAHYDITRSGVPVQPMPAKKKF